MQQRSAPRSWKTLRPLLGAEPPGPSAAAGLGRGRTCRDGRPSLEGRPRPRRPAAQPEPEPEPARHSRPQRGARRRLARCAPRGPRAHGSQPGRPAVSSGGRGGAGRAPPGLRLEPPGAAEEQAQPGGRRAAGAGGPCRAGSTSGSLPPTQEKLRKRARLPAPGASGDCGDAARILNCLEIHHLGSLRLGGTDSWLTENSSRERRDISGG
nr:ankyrin repeat domain-containing protein 34B isoform X2 [Equus asinus]